MICLTEKMLPFAAATPTGLNKIEISTTDITPRRSFKIMPEAWYIGRSGNISKPEIP